MRRELSAAESLGIKLTLLFNAACYGDENGKTLHLLANSGCMHASSYQSFHDNIVAHQQTAVPDDWFEKVTGCDHKIIVSYEICSDIKSLFNNFSRLDYLNLTDGVIRYIPGNDRSNAVIQCDVILNSVFKIPETGT